MGNSYKQPTSSIIASEIIFFYKKGGIRMEVTFKNGKITVIKGSNPDELHYLPDMLLRCNFTGTLNFEFTDPRGKKLENQCMDMYEEFIEEGKDPVKNREFIRFVCELSKIREPFAYYGPKEFQGLHHDGKKIPYQFADYHARALAEVVSNGQQDREDCLYDAFCKSVEQFEKYVDDIMKCFKKKH